ncbi:RB-associated KRAB zinc finger protein-like [Argiope bruennichi]|uniref:RB-associated KRAB zinc finger protein-like n=1 Tax=Argiope bruennichi TaxID=94029 RepID=UPI0024951749|nr:RB-associated KRAB zinc finger protein-like [Argiope bruennichi]
MAQYLCRLCDNVVTYGENHPCFFYKNYDSVYSLQKRGNLDEKAEDKCVENSNDSFRHSRQADQQNGSKKSELIHLSLFQNNEEAKSLSSNGNRCRTLAESSNNAQIWNPCDISYFNPISEVQMIEMNDSEIQSIIVSSENVESRYRLETDQRETCKKMRAVTRSSTFDIQKERELGVSGVMHATTDDGCKMYLENSKWQSLNKDKNNFIYSLECVINKVISDSINISGTGNLNVNSVLKHGSKELKNSKRQVSEGETDGLTSLEVQSQVHNKKKKMATNVKKLNSTKKYDDAVAGPSGMCPRKKKFSCRLCSKEFTLQHNLYRHYRTHTGDKPYKCDVCDKQFFRKSDRDRHYRIHTGEKPYVCDICEKKFNQISSRNTHYRTHTGDRHFVCDVCNEGFTHKKVKMTEVQSKEKVTFTASSENYISVHRPENVYREACEKCLSRNAVSDCNNTSGTANLIVNPYLPRGSKEPKNGKRHMSEEKLMAPYLCPYCRRMVTYNDNHPCYIYMIEDYENSLRQPNESNERNSKYNYAKFPLTLNDSSGNLPNENERCKYLMNDFEITFSGSGGTDIENQRGSDVSDQIYATTDDECKMSLEDSKSRSLNKDKKNFMDYLECVIINSFSDNNNISRTAESTANFDLPPGCNEPKNGKVQVSEDIIDEHISPGMHTKGYNNKKKIATDLKEPISTKADDHAVAGPSGFCSGKKKFPQIFIKKDTPKTNYRTHTDDRPFICVICNKQFSKKSNRDQHYRTHTGETPYVCDVCGRKFSQIGNHNRHYRTHTGERPFVCDFCNKGFAQKIHLKKHVRTHTGETPFVCEVCNKAFAEKGTLKAHARTHSGEKPYKCPICGKAFTTSSGCNTHQRSAHK